jgi:hypothetical protein
LPSPPSPHLSRLPRSSSRRSSSRQASANRPSTAPGLPAAAQSSLKSSLAKHPFSPPFPATSHPLSSAIDFQLPSVQPASRPKTSYAPNSSSATSAPSSSALSSSRRDRRSSSRRPPASFSANGIETSFGPPSALITRTVSYNSDFARRTQNSAAASALASQQANLSTDHLSSPDSPKSDQTRLVTIDRPIAGAQNHSQFVLSPPPASRRLATMESLDTVVRSNRTSWSRAAVSDHPSPKSGLLLNPNRPRTLRQLSDEAMESSQSSEDLFLKLADDAHERTRNAHPISPTSQFPVSLRLILDPCD